MGSAEGKAWCALHAVWEASPFTVGRSPSGPCKGVVARERDRSEAETLAWSATVTGR